MTADSAEAISVFPGQGRPGQRIGNVLAWSTTPVLVVVPAMLVRAGLVGDGLCLLGLFSLLLGATAVYCVNQGRHARLHEGDLLSARTLTGRRTVDSTRLKKVGRLGAAGRGTAADWLVLTDVHGTRIIVDKQLAGGEGTTDDAVREVLKRHSGPPVLVSDRAAERLSVAMGRRGGRIRPGRSGSNEHAAFLPLLLALAGAPVSVGLLLVSLALGGVL